MEQAFIRQDWQAYSREEHAVWATLYRRRMASLQRTASQVFLEGAEAIGLESEMLPDLERINAALAQRTGWSAVAVSGFLPAEAFFACLAERRFPTTVTIRDARRLDYVPEPDIFHDVFGHVPLHAHPVFADFLERFGVLARSASTPEAVTKLARLFWFTVEFGLVRENGGIRVYGSGLISSHADAAHALGPDCERRPFELDRVLSQPFTIDRLQQKLFVIESFDELFDAVKACEETFIRAPLDR